MNPEHLPSHESKTEPEILEIPDASGGFHAAWVENNYRERTALLENLKSSISLKIYYATADKLKKEHDAGLAFLNADFKKTTELSRYSFVLDPSYFEQKFL